MNIAHNNFSLFNVFLKQLALLTEVFSLHSFSKLSIKLSWLAGMVGIWLFYLWIGWFVMLAPPSNGFSLLLISVVPGIYHIIRWHQRMPELRQTGKNPYIEAEPWLVKLIPGQKERVKIVYDPALAFVAGLIVFAVWRDWLGIMLITSAVARFSLRLRSLRGADWKVSQAVKYHESWQKHADELMQRTLDDKNVKPSMGVIRADQSEGTRIAREMSNGKQYTGRINLALPTKDETILPAAPEPEDNLPAAPGSFREMKQKRQQTAQKKP